MDRSIGGRDRTQLAVLETPTRCERFQNEAAGAVESEDAPLKSGRVMRRARKRGLNFKRSFEVGRGKRKTFRFQKTGALFILSLL